MALDWEQQYETRLSVYGRLMDEVLFALEAEIRRAGIKAHAVTGRVKSLASLQEKARRKSYANPLEDAGDIVGVRVVVLFMSDLPVVGRIVRETFAVLSTEDRVDRVADASTFGYMSHHYDATIKPTHTGPRYDDLRGVRFEVQVRTLLMDAWANVSHYLAYKGETSIPSELRRDFYALSGLFYVADKHFEMFIEQSRKVEERAASHLQRPSSETVELNLDTLTAFLHARYPDRRHGGRADMADLADELLGYGYRTLGELEQALDAARSEPPDRPHADQLLDVGVARVTLYAADPRFQEFGFARAAEADNYEFDEYDEPYDPSEDDPWIEPLDE